MTALDELLATRTAAILRDAIGGARAAELRARFEHAGYTRYALLDRGSYDVRTGVHEPELFAAIVRIAAQHTGRSLEVVDARAVRLGPGDYLLAHHDRIHDGRHVEIVLDLSAASVPGAEVHYRHRGQVFFRFASQPGALSVVERGPTITCSHTYVSKLRVGASVARLVVLLRDAATKI